jgi:hypothetical protein
LERIIYIKLYKFCEKNNFLSFQKSSFSKHRGVKDNLTFLTQKIVETFKRRKKMCCIFFDISMAFDKVWHNGLLYKLVLLKFPLYIVNWIKNFLKDRKFQINLNYQLSLSELADWLSKWKMKMSATKCNNIIFHNGPTRPKALYLRQKVVKILSNRFFNHQFLGLWLLLLPFTIFLKEFQ